MHAVLDGAATKDERTELERVLATDASARAQFDELRRLFDILASVPQLAPPTGFADQVMGALRRTSESDTRRGQPFAESGVIAPSGSDILVRGPSERGIIARTTSGPFMGSEHMSKSKRGLWITGGVAAAVAAVFIGGLVDMPTTSDNVTGTIVPAQRYRAPQPGDTDVKVGQPAGTQAGTSNVPASAGDSAGAANAAANAANNAAANAANNAAANAANNAAANAANNAAANAANNAAANAANNAAANAANNAAANAANNAAANAANNAAANAANNSAKNAANNAAANAANNAAANAASNSAKNAANNSSR
jgi:hypothetical protein